MKKTIEIKNLLVNANFITFSLSENLTFNKSDFSIYIDNSKIPQSNFSLENSNQDYSLTILSPLPLTTSLYFFIDSTTYFSGIIYIYYEINLLEFNNNMSALSLNLPSELKSYNYNFSFLTLDNTPLSSPPYPITICNGISPSSTIQLLSSTNDGKEFELTLFDSLGNSVPDAEYLIEIMIGE